MALGGGQLVDQAAGKDVDPLDVRIADDEAPRVADADGHFHCEADADAAGRDHFAHLLHPFLHREPAGDRVESVVAVEPARDGVSAEIDDGAAFVVEHVAQHFEDTVQVAGELLRAAVGSELAGKRLGERGEARDVGEQRGAADAIGERDPSDKGPPAVARNIGLEVLQQLAGRWRKCFASVLHRYRAGCPRCR